MYYLNLRQANKLICKDLVYKSHECVISRYYLYKDKKRQYFIYVNDVCKPKDMLLCQAALKFLCMRHLSFGLMENIFKNPVVM
jgi:hypothetical protein